MKKSISIPFLTAVFAVAFSLCVFSQGIGALAAEKNKITLYDTSVNAVALSSGEIDGVSLEVKGFSSTLKDGGEYNGKSYTKLNQAGGSSSDSRYIKITVSKSIPKFSVYVVASPNGSDERSIAVQSVSDGARIIENKTFLTTTADSSVLVGAVSPELASGEYYLTFSSDVRFAEISIILPSDEDSSIGMTRTDFVKMLSLAFGAVGVVVIILLIASLISKAKNKR